VLGSQQPWRPRKHCGPGRGGEELESEGADRLQNQKVMKGFHTRGKGKTGRVLSETTESWSTLYLDGGRRDGNKARFPPVFIFTGEGTYQNLVSLNGFTPSPRIQSESFRVPATKPFRKVQEKRRVSGYFNPNLAKPCWDQWGDEGHARAPRASQTFAFLIWKRDSRPCYTMPFRPLAPRFFPAWDFPHRKKKRTGGRSGTGAED